MKNKKLLTPVLLLFIILVASFLRLYQLGMVPSSPDWDEAALGYNAYSILQTGRDEYGKFMPIVLRSFDDYKPALYMYFIAPLIPLFGVDIISVRLPSAILGILTVLASYFLIKELFKKKDIALLTSFLLAISPMSIQFSRVAFETNTGVAFNVFGAYFFLKGLKKPIFLILSALFFGLNLSVYQSDRVFTPLLALAFIAILWKQVFAIPKKYLIGALLVGIITILPLAINITTNTKSLYRFKGVSIFSEPTTLKNETQKRYIDDKNNGNITGVLFHNRWVAYSREIMSGYLSHFDLNWLFIRGDLARHHAPSMALLYLWELPFLLIGIYSLIFNKFTTKTKLLIFAWFLLAPVPAAVTNGVPHSVRTLNFLPTFQIFVALGIINSFLFFNKYKSFGIRYLIFSGVGLFAAFNFVYYLNQYFVQQNYFTSQEWQYGYKETVSYVQEINSKYKKIVVSDRAPFDQSHMFFLFYLKYPPELYQMAGNASGGFLESHKFDKYEFRPIDWANEERSSDILYIGRPQDFERGGNILKTINYLDGKPAIVIVEG
ncbi:glycosyltransferase family 39 protein [Patescibacteria group bacterium]|nr:glycosyltransferase family 39 protein [Patescibacteria group bacterium]MBU4098552.1 glycosyltransferase family 39 protein [Patescibacteria group bacterium]